MNPAQPVTSTLIWCRFSGSSSSWGLVYLEALDPVGDHEDLQLRDDIRNRVKELTEHVGLARRLGTPSGMVADIGDDVYEWILFSQHLSY